jgi:hypothetical protein
MYFQIQHLDAQLLDLLLRIQIWASKSTIRASKSGFGLPHPDLDLRILALDRQILGLDLQMLGLESNCIHCFSGRAPTSHARSAQLKEEVAVLQKELADVAGAQEEMDKLRAEEKGAYDKNSAEMEKGVKGQGWQ